MASSNPNYTALPFTTDGFNLPGSQGKSDISTTKLNPANARLTQPPNTSANIMEKITHLSNRLRFLTEHNTDFRVNISQRLNNLKLKILKIKTDIRNLPGPNTPPTEEVKKLRQQLALAQTAVETLTNEKATTARERDKATKDLQDANVQMTSLVSEIDKYVGLDFNNLNDVLQLVTEIEQEIESVESEVRNRGGSGPSGGGGGSGGVPASGGGGRVGPGSVPGAGGRLPPPPAPPSNLARRSFINRARQAGTMGTAANAFAGRSSGAGVPVSPRLPLPPSGNPVPRLPPPPAAATGTAASGAAASGAVPPPPPVPVTRGGKSKKLRKKQNKKSKTKRRKH